MKNILTAAALLFVTPAVAQHVHHKGPNGGPMQDVAGTHLEMVTSGRIVTFHIVDEAGKPVLSKGFSGSALIVAGGQREMVSLVAADTALKAEAKSDIPKGATISVTLKTAEGKTGQVKFGN